MLRCMVFENLVHFKNREFIDFIKTPSKKTENVSIDNSSGPTECTSIESGLNIFVGANFCGKSSVVELIRRCMTENINISQTSSFDPKSRAYVFSEFELECYQVMSGFIKLPKENDACEIYKIFLYRHKDNTDVYLRWKKPGHEVVSLAEPICTADLEKGLLLSITDKIEENIALILKKINLSERCSCLFHKILAYFRKRTPEKPNWKSLEEKFVTTFPMRGIGIVHWSRSRKIKDKSNYREACERAEVLKELLFCKSSTENCKGKEYFDYITYPEKFEFVKEGNEIVVKHNNSAPFPLLKTSEGIIEAKITSLLLGQNDIQTLCLEDPDRGMHPQMIERLKTVLHCEGFTKTIIVVTHSPYFVTTVTINKTHVFFRKSCERLQCICSVTNADIHKVANVEIFRTLLFATKALLVEGPTDREVVQAIFSYLQTKTWKNETDRIANVSETLQACNRIDFTTYQIIPIYSCENATKVQLFCKTINLPCVCLLDLDKFVKVDKKNGKIVKFHSIPNKLYRDKLQTDYAESHISKFKSDGFDEFALYLKSEHETFVWKGDLEDAILSSKDPTLEKAILDSLPIDPDKKKKPQKSIHDQIKDKLLMRLSFEERVEFCNLIIEVPEIKRFIDFLKKNELDRIIRSMHFSSRRDCPVFLLSFSQVFPNVYFLRFFLMPSVYVCYVFYQARKTDLDKK